MGTKLPSSAASGDSSDSYHAIQGWHLEKKAWQRNRAMQNNKTADVLRYTETGGDKVAKLEPTRTPVSGLTGLDVFADNVMKRYERKFGIRIEEADQVFIFYDVTDAITIQDQIEFENNRYTVVEVDFEVKSGRTEVLAKMNRSSV